MAPEEPGSTPAKVLYRPIGLAGSLLGGLVAGEVFQQVWKHATPGDNSDAPRPLESEYRLREILLAAAIQGVIFSLVKALVTGAERARLFQRWTGEWPGD
jgi:hypothetical protein